MTETPINDLENRFVGKRFYNTSIDEAFTVVDVRWPLLIIQYDDGTGWDEMAAPELLTDTEAERFGVETAGIEDSQYNPIPDGLALRNTCSEYSHDWTPTPSELSITSVEDWNSRHGDEYTAAVYEKTVRCRRCGLSGDVVSQFLGHALPTICYLCESDVMPSEDEPVWDATPDWRDATLCAECAAEAQDSYELPNDNCLQCGAELSFEDSDYMLITGYENDIDGFESIPEKLGVAVGEEGAVCNSCHRELHDKSLEEYKEAIDWEHS